LKKRPKKSPEETIEENAEKGPFLGHLDRNKTLQKERILKKD